MQIDMSVHYVRMYPISNSAQGTVLLAVTPLTDSYLLLDISGSGNGVAAVGFIAPVSTGSPDREG